MHKRTTRIILGIATAAVLLGVVYCFGVRYFSTYSSDVYTFSYPAEAQVARAQDIPNKVGYPVDAVIVRFPKNVSDASQGFDAHELEIYRHPYFSSLPRSAVAQSVRDATEEGYGPLYIVSSEDYDLINTYVYNESNGLLPVYIITDSGVYVAHFIDGTHFDVPAKRTVLANIQMQELNADMQEVMGKYISEYPEYMKEIVSSFSVVTGR